MGKEQVVKEAVISAARKKAINKEVDEAFDVLTNGGFRKTDVFKEGLRKQYHKVQTFGRPVQDAEEDLYKQINSINISNTVKGTLIGTAVGAGVGGVSGVVTGADEDNQKAMTIGGAVIGGITGGVAGRFAGSRLIDTSKLKVSDKPSAVEENIAENISKEAPGQHA